MAVTSRGRFVWHEVMTTDPDAAIAFYRQAIGWDVMSWDRDTAYRMFAWKNVPMAGVMLLPTEAREQGVPPHWLTYVSVPDVDAAVTQALGLGGHTYLEPMDVPTVGRLAVLADPQHATFAVFTPETAHAGTDDFTIGDFSWHELATDDWKAAWEFYKALFGWEYDSQMDMGPMGVYWMFRRAGGSRALGGMFNRPPRVPMPHWLPYIHVGNADSVVERVRRHGGSVLNGPMEVPGGDRVAQFADPQGAAFAVHALAAKVEPAPAVAGTPKAKPTTKAKPATRTSPQKPVKQPAATRKSAKKAPKKGTRRPVKKVPVKKR